MQNSKEIIEKQRNFKQKANFLRLNFAFAKKQPLPLSHHPPQKRTGQQRNTNHNHKTKKQPKK